LLQNPKKILEGSFMKNYKVIAVAMILGTIIGGSVFAQEDWGGKKNFASVDLGLIVGGARYERLLTPKISVGADFYWANSFILFNELDAGVFGRYYIWKGLFGELGLGFHTHTGVEEKEYEYTYYGGTQTATYSTGVVTTGFGITPAIGWKFDPGKPGGFFVEPVVQVPITIGEKDWGWAGVIDNEVGVSVGFVLSAGLGWAF
jgi:hypothetical protein